MAGWLFGASRCCYCKIPSQTVKNKKVRDKKIFTGDVHLILHLSTKSKQLLIYCLIFIWLSLLLCYQLATPGPLQAENLSASSSFQAARKSFKSGDYEQALSLFKQAQTAGLNKPALFYNIGVCSYKLGLYEQATNAFLHTATFPKMAGLAYYNLAVVAEKQDDLDAAITWLNKAAGTGDKDEKLILLAETALSRIKDRKRQSGERIRFASLGFGYDNNVAMLESDDLERTSDKGDSFTDVFAFVRTPLGGKEGLASSYLQGSFSWRDYTDLHDYDSGTFRLEGRHHKNAGNFQIKGGAAYSYIFWDSASYSQSPIINLQANHPIGDASSYRLHYEVKYHDILTTNYDYLRGWQQRATAEFATQNDFYHLLVGYTLEENDRHDKESSPRRHLISAALEFHPVDRVAITVAATYRYSTYDLSGNDDRSDDRYEASLLLNYALSSKWNLRGHFNRTINISSSALDDYQKNMTSITLGYTF